MKNLFRFLMAVAILFTASCAKEDISSSIAGEETIEVFFATNLADLGTRAYDNGTNVTTLRYFVCDNAGNILNNLSDTIVEDDKDGKFSFSLNLIKSMEYNIYFWAHSGAYTISEEGVVSINYTNDAGENIVNANNGDLDAFYAAVNIPAGKAGTTQNVSLTRPFAQLNALTSDGAEILKNDVAGYANITSSATVEGVYSQFDLRNGAVTGEEQTVTFVADVIPTGKGEATLKENHTYLSMNYLFVPTSCVADVQFTFTATRTNNAIIEVTTPEYTSVPLKPNFRTNILGALLTNPTAFNVEVVKDYGGKEDYEIEKVHVATAESLKAAVEAAATTGGEIVLTDDIQISETITISAPAASTSSRTADAEKVIVIDGKGRTLTYTGSGANARAIDVCADSNGANVIIKNLTIDCTSSYCQRGINYNTFGNLTLENVTVKGENVTYALNLPGSSDNANVVINNSSLAGNIALNVWGENAVVTATDSHFTSVDKSTAEGYSAIALNNDGTTIADGTVVNINGGTVTALDENGELSNAVRNGTNSGVVNISESTVVTGKLTSPVAIVNYGTDQFYSCDTLQRAINKAAETNAASVVLIKDIVLTETVTVAEGATIVLDLNGKTLAAADKNAIRNNGGNLTIKNGTVTRTGDVVGYSVNNASGEIVVENATITRGLYTSGSKLTATNANISHEQSSRHAIYAYNCEVTLNSGTYHNDNAGNATIMAAGSSVVVVNGGTFSIADGRSTLGWTSSMFDQNNTAKVTIKGGIFNGGFRINSANTVLTVEGGEFNTNNGSGYTYYSGTVSIMGGTYTDANAYNFAKNHLAEGYVATEKNGVWTVVGTITSEAGLEAALAEGGEVILGANIELTKTADVTGVEATINLNGYTLTAASSNAIQANEGAKVTIKNGKIVAYEAIVRAVGGEVVIENGEYTQTGTAADSPATYRYAIDSRENGKITINGGVFKSNNGMINVSSEVVINGGKFENIVEKSITRHFAYVSAPLTINDGEFYGKANGSAGGCFFCGAASGCAITINGGKFTSLWTSGSVNRIFEVYYGGSINVTGGLFNSNGGITSFVTANTDDATKVAYPYVAK